MERGALRIQKDNLCTVSLVSLQLLQCCIRNKMEELWRCGENHNEHLMNAWNWKHSRFESNSALSAAMSDSSLLFILGSSGPAYFDDNY